MPRERNADYERISNTIKNKFKDGQWKLFVIAAEGDKVEPQYFNAFKKKYHREFDLKNLHIEYLDRTEQNKGLSNPQSVLDTLNEFCKKYQLQDYDELWIVIDTDNYNNRENVIKTIANQCTTENNYFLGLSNPCFEVWLIIHFYDLNQEVRVITGYEEAIGTIQDFLEDEGIRGRPKSCKKIFNNIHQGKIQPLYDTLVEKIEEAIPRARKLGQCDPFNSEYPNKICTNLDQLFSRILNIL